MIYLYEYSCFNCGRSDLGLELHHILGRVSDSPFNSCPLCPLCHSKANHSQEEERKYFKKTFNYLLRIKYQPTENDWIFMRENFNRIIYENI